MSYLLSHTWLAAALSGVAGFGLTWLWMVRPVEGRVLTRTASGAMGAAARPVTSAATAQTTGRSTGVATGAATGAAAGAATSAVAGGIAARGGVSYAQSRFGQGTVDALPDGSMPIGYPIKGNSDSMLFHTEESPGYRQTKAEVWFDSEDAARRAGFRHWDPKRR